MSDEPNTGTDTGAETAAPVRSIYDSVLLAVIELAGTADTYAPIRIGSLPVDNGLSMAIATGSPIYSMDKGARHELSIVLNGKHTDQATVSNTLGELHELLTTRTTYPTTAEGCQITNVETLTAPAYLDREDNSQWLYGSSLRVKFYKGRDSIA